jgi:hypothetical protein
VLPDAVYDYAIELAADRVCLVGARPSHATHAVIEVFTAMYRYD